VQSQFLRLVLTIFSRFFLVLLTASFVASCARASPAQEKRDRTSKVSPELINLYEEYSSYLASSPRGVFKTQNALVRLIEDRVVVDAVASEDVTILTRDLKSLGMKNSVAFGRTVSGQLPISAIPAMETLPSLNFVRAASGSVR